MTMTADFVVEVEREAPARGQLRPEGDEGAVAIGGAGADGDQRAHVRAAVAGRRPGGAVEDAARPDLDNRRLDQQQRRDDVSCPTRVAGTSRPSSPGRSPG